MNKLTVTCIVVSTCLPILVCGCQAGQQPGPGQQPVVGVMTNQAPLKIRGGSAKAIYYGDSGQSTWAVTIGGASATLQLNNTANFIDLDGVVDQNSTTPTQLQEIKITPNGNWVITAAFQDSSGKPDPSTTLSITGSQTASTVNFQAANGQLALNLKGATISSPAWTEVTYNVLCKTASGVIAVCPEGALQNHISWVQVNQGPQYLCPDGLCVITVAHQ